MVDEQTLTWRSAQKRTGNLTKSKVQHDVDVFFNAMIDALVNGDRIDIRGFCTFYVKEYDSYVGRNPKTQEVVIVKPKKLPFFKPRKDLRERIDKTGNHHNRISD